jgi:hypothetical protein
VRERRLDEGGQEPEAGQLIKSSIPEELASAPLQSIQPPEYARART